MNIADGRGSDRRSCCPKKRPQESSKMSSYRHAASPSSGGGSDNPYVFVLPLKPQSKPIDLKVREWNGGSVVTWPKG